MALTDGRILVAGGTGPDGPLHTVEIYDGGRFVPAASMFTPRSNHAAVRLPGGRVLVVGGLTSDGQPTWTAEIYDPSADQWTQTGDMALARSGQTATSLGFGRVLVAGGQSIAGITDTLEIFDAATGRFERVSALMTSPRTNHAAARLADRRVIFVGGHDGDSALSSIDVFHPSTLRVTPGPQMAAARNHPTATTLLNGDVLIAGGHDGTKELSSAEIFDARSRKLERTKGSLAMPRQGHTAIRLPANNSVLIIGGTAGGRPLASSELYRPWIGNFTLLDRVRFWRSAFAPTGALREPRAFAAGAAAALSGEAVIIGGEGRATAERYRYPQLRTDKPAYAAGETMTISGLGWRPGQTVEIRLDEEPQVHGPRTLEAIVDADGSFRVSDTVDAHTDPGTRVFVTGSTGTLQAQTLSLQTEDIETCTTDADCTPSEDLCVQTACFCNDSEDDPPCGDLGGVCAEFGGPQNCPEIPCERCNPQTGSCEEVIACTDADDCPREACVFNETLVVNECAQSGTPCDSFLDCPREPCLDGTCVNSRAGEPCDDQDACTDNDVCQATTACSGQPVSCDDNIACTVDSCDETAGCVHTPDDSLCTDDGNPCTDTVCDPQEGCVNRPVEGRECDLDNSQCTPDACDANGVCQPGDEITCPQGDQCQAVSCDPATGECTVISNAEDGTPCNADDNACTVDTCQEGTCQQGPVSPEECDGLDNDCDGQVDEGFRGKMTGGGQLFITVDGKKQKITFGFNAKGTVGGKDKGHFNYVNHSTRTHINGKVVEILFACSCEMKFVVKDRKTGCKYEVTVTDGGEPNQGKDTFGIRPLSPPPCPQENTFGPQPVPRGNIQCHNFKDRDEDDDDDHDDEDDDDD